MGFPAILQAVYLDGPKGMRQGTLNITILDALRFRCLVSEDAESVTRQTLGKRLLGRFSNFGCVDEKKAFNHWFRQ